MEINMKQNHQGCNGWQWKTMVLAFLVFVSPSPLLPFSPSGSDVWAAERAPENLLPSTTQIYARWDGFTAHKDAYRNSARGKMFSGEAGKALDAIWEQIERYIKRSLAGEKLLEGMPPDELAKIYADVKALLRMPNLLLDTGIVAGFEIRPPAYDLGKLWKLIVGNPEQREKMKTPQFLLTIIVPGAGDKPELAAAIRLLKSGSSSKIEEQEIAGRKVTILRDSDESGFAGWSEAGHFVFTYGNVPFDGVVRKIKDAGKGVTENPLFKKLGAFKDFEVVTRGYIDIAAAVSTWGTTLKAFEPDLWAVAEASGLTGIKSICFWNGFEGEESRGVIELEFTGKRKGLTRMFQPQPSKDGIDRPAPLKMEDLPPLPADLTRFAAARLDPGAVYDSALLIYMGLLGAGEIANDEDKKLPAAERLAKQREAFQNEIDGAIGFKLADLFATLGDKVVTYHAPSDGLPLSGQVLAISVKDAKALRRYLDLVGKKIESGSGKDVRVRKRDCLGIEVREFVVKERSPVTVSYAICDGWLVIGLQPQPVRGFIHRAKGNLPTWKPDERTARTLAKVPADCCVLQVADPRPTLQWFFGAGPILTGMLGKEFAEIIETGIIPHAGEASKHLFPNVMWCRDDGKTMRWESRDSLWLPLEFAGLESILAGYGLAVGVIR
jgi:hypothetical protein